MASWRLVLLVFALLTPAAFATSGSLGHAAAGEGCGQTPLGRADCADLMLEAVTTSGAGGARLVGFATASFDTVAANELRVSIEATDGGSARLCTTRAEADLLACALDLDLLAPPLLACDVPVLRVSAQTWDVVAGIRLGDELATATSAPFVRCEDGGVVHVRAIAPPVGPTFGAASEECNAFSAPPLVVSLGACAVSVSAVVQPYACATNGVCAFRIAAGASGSSGDGAERALSVRVGDRTLCRADGVDAACAGGDVVNTSTANAGCHDVELTASFTDGMSGAIARAPFRICPGASGPTVEAT